MPTVCLVLGAVLGAGYHVEKTDGALDLMELPVKGGRQALLGLVPGGGGLGAAARQAHLTWSGAVTHPHSHPPPRYKERVVMGPSLGGDTS